MNKMGYVIYLAIFLIAGFLFSRVVNPKTNNDLDYKIAMAKAQLEWFGSPEWEKWNDAMNNSVYKQEIEYPINFRNSFWTTTKPKIN